MGYYGIQDTHNERLFIEWDRLVANGPYLEPEVGQRVVFAAGMVGSGWYFVRKEGEVIARSNNCAKLRYESGSHVYEVWVQLPVIIDILEEGNNGSE